MNLTHEDTNLVITALQDMRANLYINNNIEEMHKVSKVIKGIENEMESKDVSSKKIMLNDGKIEIGSETGIEKDYQNQIPRRKCEVCDD
jgi:hypothetical protein|tara:strand:- start:177 stop:443 length:267 start_codon:yes stop_codon:yes gene_type:complete